MLKKACHSHYVQKICVLLVILKNVYAFQQLVKVTHAKMK